MKTMIRLFLLVGAMFVASSAFAASDYYLHFKGGKGGEKKVPILNDACTVSDLAPGEYTVTVCTADGKALATEDAAACAISSPRDVATGQSSGKRQHGEIKIIKEWSAASPALHIAIDEPGTTVTLKCGISTSRSNIKRK
jgi:hypothetical protein